MPATTQPELPHSPLSGQTVLVTRPVHQADSLARLLTDAGASVLFQPTIEILPPTDWAKVDQALDQLDRFRQLVFVSSNGVRLFANRAKARGGFDRLTEWANASNQRVVSIGSGTAAALSEFSLPSQSVPGKSDSDSVADFLIEQKRKHTSEQPVLILRADRGSKVLPERLTEAAVSFEQVVVYRSVDCAAAEPAIEQALHAGEIDWVTVTSSAIGRSLVQLFGDSLRGTKLVSISPTTSAALNELGFAAAAEASEHDMPGIVAAIVNVSGK